MFLFKKYPLKSYLFWIFFACSFLANAQFSFNVTKTDETCVGNGTMTFSLSNTNPNADYTFVIYKQPNLTVPYQTTTSTFIEHLSWGEYVIEAIETLNGASSTITQTITIEYLVVPLQYYVVEHPTCNGVNIEIITIAGNPISYEIFNGPETYPLQSSNIFEGLMTDQTYQIRIFDDCGEGYVRTHTIELQSNLTYVYVDSMSYLLDCTTFRAYFLISSVSEINSTNVTYTLTRENGEVHIFTDVIDIPQGDSYVYVDLPFFGEMFSFMVELLDCINFEYIDLTPTIDFQIGRDECGEIYFGLFMRKLLPPYTVNFTSFPDEFNPLDFNENYPLHNDDYILYGMMDNPLPFGEYTFEVSDSCGYSETLTFESSYAEEDRILGYGNNGCGQFSGYFLVKFSTDRTIVYAEITNGPEELAPFPLDISEFINEDGDLRVMDFPAGTYNVTIMDSCGFEYEDEVTIPEMELQPLSYRTYVNCSENLAGSLQFYTVNGGGIESAFILNAPPEFPYSLPYDATQHINANGTLFFPDLPMGQYSIEATDTCGFHEISSVFVQGDIYNTAPYIRVDKQCNVFDLEIDSNYTPFSLNGTYWLQYYNETTGEWEHPYTGVPYIAGTTPTEENSIHLIIVPWEEIQNVGIFGNFRIVKVFSVITSDSPYQTQTCIKENYYTFNYSQDLTIIDAYRITCENNDNIQSVFIQADGIPPLSYYITSKDGQPFAFDNGENAIFTDLEPAIYNFQVRDTCGNIRNREFDLNDIQLMVNDQPAENIVSCPDELTDNFQVYLPDKNIYLIASTLSVEYFNFSYHSSYNQAYNNQNPLPHHYTISGGNEIRIYVRVENTLIPDCFTIVHFDIIVIETPDISDIQTDYSLCENQESVMLIVPHIFDNYLWNTGETTSQIEVYQSGTYSVIVNNTIDNVVCEKEIIFTVSTSSIPEIENISYADWTYVNNSITINTLGSGSYLYSLDGIHYQQSNFFDNLTTGYYTVYVKNDCGETTSEALLLNYPRFFTPNGDGFNEFWRIEFGSYEPEMRISIFDRYGKLIKVFMGNEQGWDGTLNGKKLLSTDYWFTVERKNGIIRKGHFSMVR